MWSYIINPFITALTLFYSFTGNIVLSIVVFTAITRMLLYPLTMQQQKSMKAQQKLQPKIKKLQEKYKNDREALAQAQMKLMQEEGANPFGGCLLMFVQLPIFLGLYQAIIYSLAATPLQLLDMSGRLLIPGLASNIPLESVWMGMDLTLPPTQNPIYAMALPLLVMGTTWAQSKLTMANSQSQKKDTEKDKKKKKGDDAPNQAEMMTKQMTTIMPLMFGFFSLSFSVGISIYFITSNLIGAFQYGVLARGGDEEESTDDDGETKAKASEAADDTPERQGKKDKASKKAKKAATS